MIKKVIFLILSLLLFVIFITYGDFFEFKLNEIQFDTLKKSLIIYATLALLCFIIGELSKNYSQVDKVWSIAPIIYVWFFTIPPQVQLDIASRKKFITDEYSGRILVDKELAEEENEKMSKLFTSI